MRKSNMELLRIVAMLLVLVLHATFETMHYPNSTLVRAEPASWLGIILTEQASICCVDVFVLITGWFGTHFKLQNIFRLLFQVAFISLSVTAGVALLQGQMPGTPVQIIQSVFGYWFINSYLVMYLLSPVLNRFVEQEDEAGLRRYLLLFFTLAIPASFAFSDLNRGFSAISFCGLYLLGRYLRLHLSQQLASWHRRRFVLLFACNTIGFGVLYWLYFWLKPLHYPNPTSLMTAYTNPFVIANAACLILYFARLNFSNRLVNWLAAGSLAAYLTHQQVFARPAYFDLIRHLDATCNTPLFILTAAGSILIIFIISALLDHIRKQIWELLSNRKTANKG